MKGVLIVAECLNGRVADSARSLVNAAKAFGERVTLGLLCDASPEMLSQACIVGVDDLLVMPVASSDFDAEFSAAAVKAMMADTSPRLVLMPYTIRSASFAPAVAESLNLGFVSDAVALRGGEGGGIVAARPVYGGKIQVELELSSEAPALVLVRGDAWPAAEIGPPVAAREIAAPPPAAPRVRHVGYQRPPAGVDLTRADVIFAVGRGVGEAQNVAQFAVIAEKLGVGLGASRPLVDSGWLPAPHQVGQTGVTVKPKLYVAFGISGAAQHLSGMQASGAIVAVNTDRDAAIFDFADVGAVADINEVAKEMLTRLGG